MVFSKKILTLSIGIVIAACLIYFLLLKKNPNASPEDSSQVSSEEVRNVEDTPLPVKVTLVRKDDLIIKLKSPGEAVTNKKIILKAEVSGVIKNLNVEESKHVKKGEMLVELDDKEYRLSLEREEADRLRYLSEMLLEKRFSAAKETPSRSHKEEIKKAEEEFGKARQLFRKGLISRVEFEKTSKQYEVILIESGEKKDEIRAASKGLTQAEIAVKQAQMNLEKTKIRAPFSGIICDIQVSPQEHVTSSRNLFTLVNISRIQVHAKVLESEIGKMKVGREVDLRFSAYSGKVFKGKVKAISPIINPADKTCKVTIDMANPQEEIKPGMHTEVEIAAEIYKDRLLIPQEAVLSRGGRKLAFVFNDGLAKWRYLEVGLENEDYVEVLDGVKEGEQVIIEGHFTLAHDARVRIVK